jgi:signal transduction histidine kinase
LIIAKRIAELHGGSLSITSDAENGTTVTVKLLPTV